MILRFFFSPITPYEKYQKDNNFYKKKEKIKIDNFST